MDLAGHRRRVPWVAIVACLGAAAVVSLRLLVSTLASFFNLVLSGAGFFLLAGFFLDSVTATVFLTVGHRRLPDLRLRPHSHRWLPAGSLLASAVMGALLVAFFFYGPRAIGKGVDVTLAVLIGIGVLFAWATRRRVSQTWLFHGNDITVSAPRVEEITHAAGT